jgi:hypothetical protein
VADARCHYLPCLLGEGFRLQCKQSGWAAWTAWSTVLVRSSVGCLSTFMQWWCMMVKEGNLKMFCGSEGVESKESHLSLGAIVEARAWWCIRCDAKNWLRQKSISLWCLYSSALIIDNIFDGGGGGYIRQKCGAVFPPPTMGRATFYIHTTWWWWWCREGFHDWCVITTCSVTNS